MRYYVQYPIFLDCTLKCDYCFHADHMRHCILGGPQFEPQKYAKWRDKHLQDAEDIILHFHGGEPSTRLNVELIKTIAPYLTKERIDILTNGLGEDMEYSQLLSLKVKWHRAGFTYHRKIIGNNQELTDRYMRNLIRFKEAGIPVYAKELLFTDMREEIIAQKAKFEAMGIEYKIQDFKGNIRGEDFTEFAKYTAEDMKLISEEYVHPAVGECYCIKGYKNIIIRGGWQDGDVLACWIDPCVVGNIHDGTYNPNYKVIISQEKQTVDVTGVPKVYRGTYYRDRYFEHLKGKEHIMSTQRGENGNVQPQEPIAITTDAVMRRFGGMMRDMHELVAFICDEYDRLQLEYKKLLDKTQKDA